MQTTSICPCQFSQNLAYALLFKYVCDWNNFLMSYVWDYRVIAPDLTSKMLFLEMLSNSFQLMDLENQLMLSLPVTSIQCGGMNRIQR